VASFEEEVTQAQTAMIAAAVDYASNKADDVYIYFSMLSDMLFVQAFFARQGEVCYVHKLPEVDVSVGRQNQLLDECMDELMKIRQAAIEHERAIPREGWIHYHVGGSVDARYSYRDIAPGVDPQWSEKLDAWMKSVQRELETR